MLRQLSWLLPASCTDRLTKTKSEGELPSHVQGGKGEDGGDEDGDPTDVLDAESHGGASVLSIALGLTPGVLLAGHWCVKQLQSACLFKKCQGKVCGQSRALSVRESLLNCRVI